MVQRIASRDNERVKHARRLATSAAARAEEGLLFAEGRRLCFDLAETLKAKRVFVTEAFLKAHPEAEGLAPEAFIISEPVDDKLSETKTPQGLYCLFEKPATGLAALKFAKGVLLCEGVQDPANVGAVLRSAAAFGYGGVLLLRGCADAFSPRTLRAAMGAVGRIPIVADMLLEEGVAAAKAAGATVYASALLADAQPLQQVRPRYPVALLVGSEGAGLTPEALALADSRVYIPMQGGVQSLNAAAAAAVLLYALAPPPKEGP